jgi:hypothetical protein
LSVIALKGCQGCSNWQIDVLILWRVLRVKFSLTMELLQLLIENDQLVKERGCPKTKVFLAKYAKPVKS